MPVPGPDSCPAPPPVRFPYFDLPVRLPFPALPGDGNGRRCRPGVRRGTVGRRIVAEVFPERAARHPWATEWGGNVARACGAATLGDGIGRKCSPGVRRGTLGRRIVAEVFPERAVMHCWATDSGRNVPRACDAAPLGDGNGRKCSLSVPRSTIGRRKRAEVSPKRVARSLFVSS